METPLTKYRRWTNIAKGFGESAEELILSTVSPFGEISSRTVLLKAITDNGLVFFTNYKSRKAQDIETCGRVCVLQRFGDAQIITNGIAKKVDATVSDNYFETRPYLSKLGAWASKQSTPGKRVNLLLKVLLYALKFGRNVPRPDFWGGYVIIPDSIEFWRACPGRLHVRELYTKNKNNFINQNNWTKTVLNP